MNPVSIFLSGAITAQCLVVSLFFIQYACKTSDAFFRYFAFAFILLAAERIIWVLIGVPSELQPVVYLFRLAAFSVIIAAILKKNLTSSL